MRTITKLLSLIVSLPFFLFAISFSVSNTDPLPLGLWPFQDVIYLPIALAVFIILIAGFAIGALSAFLGAGKLRRKLRTAQLRIRHKEMEAARAKRASEAAEARLEAAALEKTASEATALEAPKTKPALAAE